MANEPDVEKFVRAVEDATTFPLLTQNAGSRTSTPAGGLTPASTSSFGSLVRNTLHEVLQWRPSTTDVKGLKEALLVSFNARETSGRTVYTHVPRSYIMQVQSDGGAVTGAQASIHTRAKAAVDQSLPLLEGLYPLNTDSDSEDLVAVRATIHLALTGLVEELARPGGPRVQRVDTLFELLLGKEITDAGDIPDRFNADEVDGQLGLLRDRLGLAIQRVNTAEEEKNLTNFLILADHVFTLWLSWRSLHDFFDRTGNDVFLGPQLVLLSRSLRVLSESVHETYCALDSVFVGPAEREVIVLPFEDETPLTLADLLEWVDTFASSEGPQLIQQAGKDGVIAFRSTLEQLNALLDEAVEISQRASNNPVRGFHTRRVAAALQAVLLHVRAALELAAPLSRLPLPLITGVHPGEVQDAPNVHLQVNGANFDPGATVKLTRDDEDIPAELVHFVSPTTLFADFDLAGVPAGVWSVVVRNPDGAESAFALTVENVPPLLEDPPHIRELTPDEVEVGAQGIDMEIEGSNFQTGLTITLEGPDVSLASTPALEGDSRVTFKIDVEEDAALGSRTVVITNPGGKTAEVDFQVVEAEEIDFQVDSVEPDHARQGEEPVVKVLGSGFEQGMSTNFGPQIRTQTIFLSSTELEVHLRVRKEASTGPRTIKVISQDRKRRAAKVDGFTVDPADSQTNTETKA